MRIAAVIPIGYIDRWGYQRHLHECIGSFAGCADATILVGSHRETPGIDALLAACPRASFVCDERTWFTFDADGNEVFDFGLVNAAENVGLDEARAAGCDVAIQTSSNWYVTPGAWDKIAARCEKMLRMDDPFAWLVTCDQLGRQMFRAATAYPWIVNLHHGWRFAPVGALTDGRVTAEFGRGDLSNFESEAIVDAPLEITIDELRDKMNYFRCYHDLLKKRDPIFDWGYWRDYYVKKFGQKAPSADAPQGVGVLIAKGTRDEFVSNVVLRGLGL